MSSKIRRGVNKSKKSKNKKPRRGKKTNKKMTLTSKVKKFLYCVASIVLLFLSVISYASGILNPFVVLKGVILINQSNRSVVQLSDFPLRYICDSFYDLTNKLEYEGYAVIPRDNRIIEVKKYGQSYYLKSNNFLGLYEVFNEVEYYKVEE